MVTTTRATRYKEPEIPPHEMALLDWFRRLSPDEQAALQDKAQEREPIGPLALEELARDFERDLTARGKAKLTVDRYSHAARKFQDFLSRSEQDVTEMGLTLVGEYIQSLVAEGYGRKTVQSFLDGLKSFTRYLRLEGVLGMAQVPKPQAFTTKVPQELPKHLSQEEVRKLLDTPDDKTYIGIRDRAILELFYATGLRLAELVGLDLEDIDLDRLTLFVRHGKGNKQRVGFFGKPCQ